MKILSHHRQPKLTLRAAHKLDCFFHVMHNEWHRHLRVCMEMPQNVSNCHKSESSRNKTNLPYFIVVLVIISWLPGLVWSFLDEKLRFLSFIFAERLELIKGRTQLHTAPHLKLAKFHHNERITLKLQMCILGSLAYLRSLSWVLDRSFCKLPKTPLKYETRLSWYEFSFEEHAWIPASRVSTTKLPSAGERLSVCA